MELSADKFKQRVLEAKKTGRLNLSYLELEELSPSLVSRIRTLLPSLSELDLRSNALAELPEELADLKTLRVLRLNYNRLQRMPAGGVLAALPKLQVLELSGNHITELSDEVALLTGLRELDLSGNKLTQMPEAITALENLTSLNLENNQLLSVPESLGSLSSLSRLDVSTNRLTSLPSSVGRLSSLTRIDLSTNNLADVPPSLGNCRGLRELDLRYNALREPYKARYEEGLTKFMEFLRYEEERLRQEELERLKPVGHELAYFTEFWVGEGRECPPVRTGHTVTHANETTYFFGGCVEGEIASGNTTTISATTAATTTTTTTNTSATASNNNNSSGVKVNEVVAIDMETMEWKRLPTSGAIPPARDGHAAAHDPDTNRLYVFGGRSNERKRLNDLHYLDLKTRIWHKPGLEGLGPTPREGVSAVVVRNTLVLFGGHGSGQRYNEHWVWSQPVISGAAPSPRQGAALALALDTTTTTTTNNNNTFSPTLYMHGGRSNFVLGDLYALDLKDLTWREVQVEGRAPAPRHSHSAAVRNGRLLVFGGVGELGGALTGLYALTLAGEESGNVTQSPPVTPRQQTHERVVEDSAVAGKSQGGGDHKRTWVELQGELEFNLHRTCCFGSDYSILLYQYGSPAKAAHDSWQTDSDVIVDTNINAANGNSPATPNNVSSNGKSADGKRPRWDVFRIGQLESFVETPLDGSSGDGADSDATEKGKAKRARVEHTIRTKVTQAACLTSVTARESGLLGRARAFARAFRESHPSRRAFGNLLVAKNECGVERIICQSIRPTQLAYTELYEAHSCALFLANFLRYEPLEDPLQFPEYFPSPYSVLQWQAGDCFDFSMVLTSLLIGAGYDAYCVAGYAPRDITLNNQVRTECPLLESEPPASTTTVPKPTTSSGTRSEAQADTQSSFVPTDTSDIPDTNADITTTDSTLHNHKPNNTKAAPRAKYTPSLRQPMESAFEREQAELRARELAEANKGPSPDEIAREEALQLWRDEEELYGEGVDALEGRRVHAWVLVLPGRREVNAPFYLELSSGRKYAITNAPYVGVECVWNGHNFWVNMQGRGDSNNNNVSFDLGNGVRWESVLEGGEKSGDRSASDDVGDENADPAGAGGMDILSGSSSAVLSPLASPAMISPSFRRDTTFSVLAERMDVPNNNSSAGDHHNHNNNINNGPIPLDMCASWVPRLSITRDAFDRRCPKGSKMIVYRKCTLEVFAEFGECARWDGMQSRLTFFQDLARTITKEVREYFARRKDRLRERHTFVLEDKVVELFDPGNTFVLASLTTLRHANAVNASDGGNNNNHSNTAGNNNNNNNNSNNNNLPRRREARFYPTARLDGLASRAEDFENMRMEETYVGRDDHLIKRKVAYAPASANSNGNAASPTLASLHCCISASASVYYCISVSVHLRVRVVEKGKKAGEKGAGVEAQAVRKMVERFARNEAVPAKQDVAQRKFWPAQGLAQVDFHYEDDKISISSRVYTKEGLQSATYAGAGVDGLDGVDGLEGSAAAAAAAAVAVAERECLNAVRESEREAREIVAARNREEQAITLVTPYYDIVRVKKEESDDDGSEADAKGHEHDYLSPYLPVAIGTRPLSFNEALEARHDEEAAVLSKRQANLARDREQMSRQEEEECERACEESAFRLHVLETRLKRHEEQAVEKYKTLDATLREDSRLAVLAQGITRS
eukprot:jgi/Chlat1/5693/Chrsp38S05540